MSGTDLRIGRSRRRLLGAVGLAVVAAVTWVTAPATAAPAEEVIVLPGASSAEGVAIGRGSTFYAGELFGGDIFRGDLQRGTAERFIDAPPGQMALGLKVDDPTGLLFVAGGFSGQAYVVARPMYTTRSPVQPSPRTNSVRRARRSSTTW